MMLKTYSVILLAKSVAVFVSYQLISCLRTFRRNSHRMRKTLERISMFSYLRHKKGHLSGSCKVEAGDKDPAHCPQAESKGDHGITKPVTLRVSLTIIASCSYHLVRVAKTPDPAGSQSVSFPPISAFTASALASATKLWSKQNIL